MCNYWGTVFFNLYILLRECTLLHQPDSFVHDNTNSVFGDIEHTSSSSVIALVWHSLLYGPITLKHQKYIIIDTRLKHIITCTNTCYMIDRAVNSCDETFENLKYYWFFKQNMCSWDFLSVFPYILLNCVSLIFSHMSFLLKKLNVQPPTVTYVPNWRTLQ